MEPLHPRWAYLFPLILNRNAKCLQAVLTCVDAGSIGPRNIRGEDVPNAIIARCHKQVTSFKNIFGQDPKPLEKSICSRYTNRVGRLVHGGSLLCAFLYGAVFELALGHSSFLCQRREPVTSRRGNLREILPAWCIIRYPDEMSSEKTQDIVVGFGSAAQNVVLIVENAISNPDIPLKWRYPAITCSAILSFQR